MKNKLLFLGLMMFAASVFARGGDDTGNGGNRKLLLAGVSQYTCLYYNGKLDPISGELSRVSHGRYYMFYLNDALPEPMTNPNRAVVCHDEQIYGTLDSFEFPRYELIKNVYPLYSRFDNRFSNMDINKIISDRVANELGIHTNFELFNETKILGSSGFILKPFYNTSANRYYCPTSEDPNATDVEKIILDYTGNTEALYAGSVEAQILSDGSGGFRYLDTSIRLTTSTIMKYGFFLNDGIKTRIYDESVIDTDTVMLYYPFSDSIDPMEKQGRKLVVINTRNWSSRMLGCVYKMK